MLMLMLLLLLPAEKKEAEADDAATGQELIAHTHAERAADQSRLLSLDAMGNPPASLCSCLCKGASSQSASDASGDTKSEERCVVGFIFRLLLLKASQSKLGYIATAGALPWQSGAKVQVRKMCREGGRRAESRGSVDWTAR